MSELDQLTNIITTILGQDNQARKQNEQLLAQLQIKDLNEYVIVFVNLLNGNIPFTCLISQFFVFSSLKFHFFNIIILLPLDCPF